VNIQNSNMNTSKKQSGVIMILALVMLLVLTLLAITSMNSTNFQVLLTGNTQHQTSALNQAEMALRNAEELIDIITTTAGSKPTIGYYDLTVDLVSEQDFSSFTWDSSTAISYDTKSHYVIEYSGRVSLSGGSVAVTQNNTVAGDELHLYRITARSVSARGAVRFVQSVYVTSTPPL